MPIKNLDFDHISTRTWVYITMVLYLLMFLGILDGAMILSIFLGGYLGVKIGDWIVSGPKILMLLKTVIVLILVCLVLIFITIIKR